MAKTKKKDLHSDLRDQLPKKLRILGKVWTIEHVDDLIENKGSYGRCSIGHAKIQYTTKDSEGNPLDLAMIKDTIIHEVVHAIEETAGLGLKERQVLGLGGGLYALFAENPDLIAWLMMAGEPVVDPEDPKD